jgi:hypothetical protein
MNYSFVLTIELLFEDLILLECNNTSIIEWLPIFRRNTGPLLSVSSRSRETVTCLSFSTIFSHTWNLKHFKRLVNIVALGLRWLFSISVVFVSFFSLTYFLIYFLIFLLFIYLFTFWRSYFRTSQVYPPKYNQQDATFLDLFIYINCSTCFRRFLRPSSGAQNCTYSVWYYQTNDMIICHYILIISDAVCTVLCFWWWAEEPPETCRAIYRNK